MPPRLPVHRLKTNTTELNLGGTTKVYHLPDWHRLTHPQRLTVLRQIAMMRGRDPRIAKLAVSILKKAGAAPRQYEAQAAALLKWVQDPKNVYYVNEPGERLQDPIHTIKVGHGDCFAEGTLVLRDDMELVAIEDVHVGDKIWGKDRWSQVVNTWKKGVLSVTQVQLNNGSTLRLTEGHKVYVATCLGPKEKGHGPQCACRPSRWAQCSARYGTSEVRITVAELQEGMQLLQPDKIEQPVINAPEAVALTAACGKGALNKCIPTHVLAHGDLASLDDGLKLDAAQNTRGKGWTFGTISPKLAVQYRVLQRALGRSTSVWLVADHGGFGANPIYRVDVRNPTETKDRRLLVQAIKRDAAAVPCVDIATDDHYVYLPEADCTVSNCDDQVLLLTCLFESVGLPWRLVLSGRQGQQKLRYIEGSPIPEGVAWSHIYCMVGTPPFQPKKWHFCETTVQGVPLGWDVVSGDHKYLPEMGGSGVAKLPKQPLPELGDAAAGMVSADLVRQYQANQAIDWLKIGVAVTTGVAVSVFTSLALDYINGRGIWEGRGHVLKRVKRAAEPTVTESVFVHPSPLDF